MNSPILLIPHFRSGRETPWAGDTLHRLYEKYALGNQIGESYDFCTLPGFESTAPDGTLLSSMVTSPFLIKWVDAKDSMSVHIHPQHDEYLIVVQASENAQIVTGLKNASPPFTENSFHFSPVQAGDVIYIPAGTSHSLRGVTCYQIQNTNVESLRIYDWERTNARGQKRPLQFDKALALIKNSTATKLTASQSDQLILSDDFSVCELTNCNDSPFTIVEPFSVLTCLAPATIKTQNARTLYLCAGQSIFVAGDCIPFTLTGERFFLAKPHA